jgi:hypothetical protein
MAIHETNAAVTFDLPKWPNGFNKQEVKTICKKKFETIEAFAADITPKAKWHQWALDFIQTNDPTGTCQMMLATKDFYKTVCIRCAQKNMPLTKLFDEALSAENLPGIRKKTGRFEKGYTPAADGKPKKEVKEKNDTKKIEDASWNALHPELYKKFDALRAKFASAQSPEDLQPIFFETAKLLGPVYAKLRELKVPTKDINQKDRLFTYEDYRSAKVFYTKTIGKNEELIAGHEVQLRNHLQTNGVKNPTTLKKVG